MTLKSHISIDDEDFKLVTSILDRYLKNTEIKVFVFGSRVSSTARKYSDLDLALCLENQKISQSLIDQISSEFERSLISVTVDIVDLNAISSSFKKCIEDNLVELDFSWRNRDARNY